MGGRSFGGGRGGPKPGGAGAGGRGGAGAKDAGKRYFFRRRKVCKFCADKIDYVDYKDVKLLQQFIPERSKILPRRISGTCANHQRPLQEAIKRARPEPWLQGRTRIDFPREGEAEGSSVVSLESQFARCQLRFRREMTFRQVADIRFGIEFEQSSDAFVWQVMLVPAPKYPRMDDLLWDYWRSAQGATLPPGIRSPGQVQHRVLRSEAHCSRANR